MSCLGVCAVYIFSEKFLISILPDISPTPLSCSCFIFSSAGVLSSHAPHVFRQRVRTCSPCVGSQQSNTRFVQVRIFDPNIAPGLHKSWQVLEFGGQAHLSSTSGF